MANNEDIIWEAIDEILWDIWDPIGIRGFGEAGRWEYTSYVDDVFELVIQGVNKEKIAQHLLKIEKEQMGEDGNIYHCRVVADKIISAYINLNRLHN